MFYLSRIEHTLRVPPSLLNLPILDAIKGELEKLFIDKVVANLGLCISVYDIRSVDGGFIFPSDGAATYKVVFTLIVFRPFTGEYHLDFSRIFMFRSSLCPLDLNSHQMKIMVEDADGCGSIMKYRSTYMNLMRFVNYDRLKSSIKFKIHSIEYPAILVEQPKESNSKFPMEEKPKESINVKPFAPMVITASLDQDGLGPVSWWDGSGEAEDEVEEDS
ncbi:DNA-directed RNA polymerase III subunit RPC8 isoform X2 [Cucumis melo]|uniref:DNA-directed RNA polymerase subunit n=1 Tax=Cucumis melo TaxID=3656 RepID=A0A1S3CEL3_CUCME|nr:DNA-directed RNA polymerase III subunit RPC8 isoform X2 [Cucumis melo]